ncbi:hypothetical protein [Pseudomonas sp. CGJS7]|uniref:hypothetical protein n=1 Tax=Pseudomonas sp. CGJS7 TaxID=3109348 RepID=UPI00300A439E
MKKVFLAAFGIVLVLGVVWRILSPLRHGEFSEKPVYATLQGLEFERRDDRAAVVPETRHGRLVAGVLDRNGRRVWMALGVTRGDGGIYAIPDGGEASVECETVQLLVGRYDVAADVESRLKSACIRSSLAGRH